MNTYERVLRLEQLLRCTELGRDACAWDGFPGLVEARGHIETIRAELEGAGAELRATQVVFRSCSAARPGCSTELVLHLPGGQIATACLGYGDAVALSDYVRDHCTPLRYERPPDEDASRSQPR